MGERKCALPLTARGYGELRIRGRAAAYPSLSLVNRGEIKRCGEFHPMFAFPG